MHAAQAMIGQSPHTRLRDGSICIQQWILVTDCCGSAQCNALGPTRLMALALHCFCAPHVVGTGALSTGALPDGYCTNCMR